ncbi:hypothetical protein NQZ68_034759 [Dissostichus eleginoides]|nr:hypothetical protein NQZ68_034759 [Dissostichus eleginoides]
MRSSPRSPAQRLRNLSLVQPEKQETERLRYPKVHCASPTQPFVSWRGCDEWKVFAEMKREEDAVSLQASDHEEPDSPSAAQREVRLSLLNMLSHLRHISVKTQSCRTPAVSCEEL